MRNLRRLSAIGLAISSLLAMGGCTTAGALLTVAGVATDTSVTWEIAKHVHQKLTEGDPVSCMKLNSVQRALTPRCGEFSAGSLRPHDIHNAGLQECPLVVATRDPRLWPVLPELLVKGARVSACHAAPLVELAQAQPCADFSAASPEVLAAFVQLAEADPRSVHHDAMRLLSCPSARQAGLDRVLVTWLSQGKLSSGHLSFSPLGALHPDALDSPLSRQLEARGHTAQAAQGAYDGQLPSGFDEALRTRHWAALEWWLARAPAWVNVVPPRQSNQVAWVPLAQVLVPSFMPDPADRKEMTEFLLTHGANPWQRLPGQPQHTVVSYAQWLKSPLVATLEQPARSWTPKTSVAATRGDVRLP